MKSTLSFCSEYSFPSVAISAQDPSIIYRFKSACQLRNEGEESEHGRRETYASTSGTVVVVVCGNGAVLWLPRFLYVIIFLEARRQISEPDLFGLGDVPSASSAAYVPPWMNKPMSELSGIQSDAFLVASNHLCACH